MYTYEVKKLNHQKRANESYNGPIGVAHAHTDGNRFDVVECGTDEELKLNLDLSDRLRRRSIKLKNAFLLRGVNVILYYRRQV